MGLGAPPINLLSWLLRAIIQWRSNRNAYGVFLSLLSVNKQSHMQISIDLFVFSSQAENGAIKVLNQFLLFVSEIATMIKRS